MHAIQKEYYDTYFSKYFLQDCAISASGTLAFALRNIEDTDKYSSIKEGYVRKRLIWGVPTPDLQTWKGSLLETSQQVHVTAVDEPEACLFVNRHGYVKAVGRDLEHEESRVNTAIGMEQERFFALALKTINKQAFLCGLGGLVACRLRPDVWIDLSIPEDRFPGPALTLMDMDGFAPDDLYVIAHEAGVFHYNGSAWRRLPFPSNIPLESICCGGDGQVYVSGKNGTTFVGRDAVWQRLYHGDLTLPFEDMVWHDGALWCTNDYGVWTLGKDGPERAPVPDGVYICSGHLSACNGRLLLGGMYGAARYEGEVWQVLYHQEDLVLQPEDFEM